MKWKISNEAAGSNFCSISGMNR